MNKMKMALLLASGILLVSFQSFLLIGIDAELEEVGRPINSVDSRSVNSNGQIEEGMIASLYLCDRHADCNQGNTLFRNSSRWADY